jgi:hypothetical protein
VQVAIEVADDAVQLELRILLRELLDARAQNGLAHVEGDEGREGAEVYERVEQEPRLVGGSRAELDQRLGTRRFCDCRRVLFENRTLATREVVLGKASDLVEELGAAVVVEPLRRNRLRHRGQPATNVGAQRLGSLALRKENANRGNVGGDSAMVHSG